MRFLPLDLHIPLVDSPRCSLVRFTACRFAMVHALLREQGSTLDTGTEGSAKRKSPRASSKSKGKTFAASGISGVVSGVEASPGLSATSAMVTPVPMTFAQSSQMTPSSMAEDDGGFVLTPTPEGDEGDEGADSPFELPAAATQPPAVAAAAAAAAVPALAKPPMSPQVPGVTVDVPSGRASPMGNSPLLTSASHNTASSNSLAAQTVHVQQDRPTSESAAALAVYNSRMRGAVEQGTQVTCVALVYKPSLVVRAGSLTLVLPSHRPHTHPYRLLLRAWRTFELQSTRAAP